MTNLIGQSLGRYHILEQLGEGGMATVYKAYDTRLEREVAVKVIRVDQFAPAVLERILKRFEREAKALARLTHPNIVGVIDYGEFETIPYLVMVYLPGGTLKQRMGKPIPWQDAVQLMIPIAKALDYAHEQGLIHRDVKPANILLTQKGQPMLTDFGIAKLLESEETATLTGTGLGIGTPEYMAPEQWTGKTTPQSDIYSLGVVFYELVTGRKPFIADTPAAILIKQVSDPLPHPRQYVPNLPEAIERVLFKALAKSAQDRYPDAGAFASALENLSGSAGSFQPARALDNSSATIDNFDTIQQSFTQPGMRRAPNSAQPTYPSEQKQPSTESAQLGRSPLPWIILGLVGIALVCALGGWLVGGGAIGNGLANNQVLIPSVTVSPTYEKTITPTKTVQPTLTFTPIPILTSTPSPTRELSATPVILKAPDQIEGSIEYAQEYYGISCGFTIIIHDLGNLPLKYEISWKNISKGEQYKPHNFTPENGKVVYYSPPSGYSADKNGKPTPLIGAGNAIQVSIRAFLELNTNSIYSEPAMIKLSCSQ